MSKLHKPGRIPLVSHRDDRGVFTEIFRNEWLDMQPPVQWNVVYSEPNVLRGVHVHVRHYDYLLVLRGTMLLGTCDLRRGSPDFMRSELTELCGADLALVTIPTGVAHGFYFPEPTEYIYAVTHYWDPVEDELGCIWNDPGLKLAWPTFDPVLSKRDRTAAPLQVLMRELDGREDKTW